MCILVFPRKIDQMLAICNLDIVTMFIMYAILFKNIMS
jgi:hypothetical protein